MLSFNLCFNFSLFRGQLGLFTSSNGYSGQKSFNFLLSNLNNSLDFCSSTDSSLRFHDLFGSDNGLLFIFGDHSGVVLGNKLDFMSFSKSLFVGSNKNVLKVGDLNLVFSLVLKSGSGIIDGSCGNVSSRFGLITSINMGFVFLQVGILLSLDSSNDFLFNCDNLGVSFNFRGNLSKLDFKILGCLGILQEGLLFLKGGHCTLGNFDSSSMIIEFSSNNSSLFLEDHFVFSHEFAALLVVTYRC